MKAMDGSGKLNSMQSLIKKTAKEILNQLKDKNWQYPIYQLVLSMNEGVYFGRHNPDGSFESLVEQEPIEKIGYPVTLLLISSTGETIRVIIDQSGYRFSEN